MTNREYMNKLIVLAAIARVTMARATEAMNLWEDKADELASTDATSPAHDADIAKRYSVAITEVYRAMDARDRAQSAHDTAVTELADVINEAITHVADSGHAEDAMDELRRH